MKIKTAVIIFIIALLAFSLSSCVGTENVQNSSSPTLATEESVTSPTEYEKGPWVAGFGSREIELPKNSGPLYIAGYHNGWEIESVHDLQRANAVWLDCGYGGVLIISVDCVGLSHGTVNEIRDSLKNFCKESGCTSVNVISTHDHAGVDTLGLWGPIAENGKNPEFMYNVKKAATEAAEEAFKNRRNGKLFYGEIKTENLQCDSRTPYEYDSMLYQFRFEPDDGEKGIRIINYAAHAESLRGSNKVVSRDYPGVISDSVKRKTGDDLIFTPGAVGGLVMTKELVEPFNAVQNMKRTGEVLTDYLLKIGNETELTPKLEIKTSSFRIPLDNIVFEYYTFLGILANTFEDGNGETGYDVVTEMSLLTIGEKCILMLPCEIFPELVSGNGLVEGDPEALNAIAERNGIKGLIVMGLTNDEIGYVVPPSDFFVDPDTPYLSEGHDENGKKHYEETNSVGKQAAVIISEAFKDFFK